MESLKFKQLLIEKKLLCLIIIGWFFISLNQAFLQEIDIALEEDRSLGLKLKYRSLQMGEVILIQFPNHPELKEIEGELFGRKLSFWRQGGFFHSLAGIDLFTKSGDYFLNLKVHFKNGQKFSKKYKVTIRDKSFGMQHLNVDPRFIYLSADDLAKVQRERHHLRNIWSKSSSEKLWNEPFIEPLRAEISSPFGLRRLFNSQPRGRHYGVDLDADIGSSVKATNSGRIVLARELFFAGNCIIIDHGKEIFSLYCHLSEILVQEGEIVERGQTIGQVGATGRVTGPHLHWGIKIAGVNISPYSLLCLSLE